MQIIYFALVYHLFLFSPVSIPFLFLKYTFRKKKRDKKKYESLIGIILNENPEKNYPANNLSFLLARNDTREKLQFTEFIIPANLSVIRDLSNRGGGAIGAPSFQLQTTRTGQRTYPRYTRIFNIRAGELIIIRKFQRRLIGDRRNYRRRLIKYPLLYNEYTCRRREGEKREGPERVDSGRVWEEWPLCSSRVVISVKTNGRNVIIGPVCRAR